MHAAAPYLDGQYAAFGQVMDGMDVVNKIAEVRTDFSDRPMKEQKIKTITVETFGVEYPEPEKCQVPNVVPIRGESKCRKSDMLK